ncbi:hypothetical protein Scep_008546 [Stephania cephalantha]|uniref:2Fe-2S ferredoxin-type domain-containing protein n=1 Tax=Stephania cephalantha TaxID=152367 RepID=A0AAP0KDZ7_9MAGN
MASLHFACPSFRSPEKWATHQSHRRPKLMTSSKKTQFLVCCVKNSTKTLDKIEENKPEIQLEFIGPKAGPDGSYPVDKASAVSGEKLLRNIMVDNKIELYAAYGKVMNCGGGGSCGTCIVEIVDGKELLNERTNTELRNQNLGDWLVKLLSEIRKILARWLFNGCRSGRSNHHPRGPRQTLPD